MQTQIHNHWMIAFNHVCPVLESLRLINFHSRSITEPQKEPIKSGYSGAEKKKLVDAITQLINEGINSRDEIYDRLEEMDALPGKDKKMSIFTAYDYIQKVRNKLGIPAKKKNELISQMFSEGFSEHEIAIALKTDKKNVHELLVRYGKLARRNSPNRVYKTKNECKQAAA